MAAKINNTLILYLQEKKTQHQGGKEVELARLDKVLQINVRTI